MRSIKKIVSALALLSALLLRISAQECELMAADNSFLQNFVVKNYTTSDGLPGMTITNIIQDVKGYIWIGTYDGLVRFDGVDFTTYNRTAGDKFDFASARSLMQDSRGNIWVGHNDEGVSRISADGSVTKFTSDDGIPNDKVNSLCEDKSGNIWVGTASGLCYISKDGGIVIPDGLDELALRNILVLRLYCDMTGRVWIMTGVKDDCFVYDGAKIARFGGLSSFSHSAVTDVMMDESGTVWFGLSPCYIVRVENGKETVFDIGHGGKSSFVVGSIIKDADGNIWAGSDEGVSVIHDGKLTLYDARNGLPDGGVTRMIIDHEGNIWIGLNRGGLQKLSKGKIRTIPMKSSVNSVCHDEARGITWLGTDSGLFCMRDGEFISNELTESLSGIRIRHIALTFDGELLISSFSGTPFINVLPSGEIRKWTIGDGIASEKVRVALKTKKGDYYVGTPVGLTIIGADGSVSTMTRADGFMNHYVMWLFEDDSGRVWVGTNGGGIHILRDGKIERIFNTESGLAGNVIFKISEQSGAIWICTGTGISKYIAETDSFVNFNSRNGFGTDSIFQMIVDETGVAWLTTNKGIFSVPFSELEEAASGKRKKFSVRFYGDSDGLITNGVTSVSISAKDAFGRIWFTLTDGFAIYDARKAGSGGNAPKVEIQTYFIDNSVEDYFGSEIVMAPSARRISIKYTGLSYISADSMTFSFKLDGFDKEYSDWTSQRLVSYTNLKPGTYKLHVLARNGDGLVSSPHIPVTIIKKPYIWQLAWFWAAIGATGAGIVALAIFLKIRAMRRYQIELEKKVAERTRDLRIANEKAEKLLLNILPSDVAKELTENPGKTIAQNFPNVTVLFTDIVGFTKMSGGMSAKEVVTMLNSMISMFDERAKKEGIEKIKTIGDAYMAASGLTLRADNDGALRMMRFARGLLSDVEEFNRKSPVQIKIRLGINTGNLVAGVIGKSKFIYDIWGDTVNVASRMESTGEPMRIHVTETTWAQTKDEYSYSAGVEVEVKGKGKMRTFFL